MLETMREDEDIALLLESLNGTEADLAKNVLGAAGIPCLLEGPDFDIAELGRPAHDMIRGQNLYVPRSALEQARDLLKEAWGAAEDVRDPG